MVKTMRLSIIVSLALLGCTVKVEVPQPVIEVQCFVIEVPGGQTQLVCPDGGDADGGYGE
jgi:hypothetical protein